MFEFDKKIIAEQMHLLIEYCQSYALFNKVKDIEFSGDDTVYWTHISNMAANDLVCKWCMVFGSDKNHIHWKNTSRCNEYEEHVRTLILGFFSNINEWKQYRKETIDFRNFYTSHRDLKKRVPLPNFEKGFKVSECYFNLLVDSLSWKGDQPYLEDYCEKHKAIISVWLTKKEIVD